MDIPGTSVSDEEISIIPADSFTGVDAGVSSERMGGTATAVAELLGCTSSWENGGMLNVGSDMSVMVDEVLGTATRLGLGFGLGGFALDKDGDDV